jgi:predicted dehydrogenase
MEKTQNIGIIGVQGYGRTYFETLRRLDHVRVTSVCDIDLQAAHQEAARYGTADACQDYHALLDRQDLDAVMIATPHFLHYPMTMDFLRAGKHVFCEKPLAIRADEAWEMAREARTLGLVLTCHYNRRQTVAVKMLRDIIQKGMLGEVYAIHARWMARWTGFLFQSGTSWRVSKDKAGGGILIGRGSHMLDAALYILGHPQVQAVQAYTSSRLTNFPVEDYALMTLRLANGANLTVECCYENNLPQYQEKIEYEVFGSRAGAYCAVIDDRETIQVGRCAFPENRWEDLTGEANPAAYQNAQPISIIQNFVETIQTGCDPLITGEQSAAITEILEIAYLSAAGCKTGLEP